MKEKYIEECVGKYSFFPEGKEFSDISTSRGGVDIAIKIPTEEAEKIIADRDKLVDALIFVINRHGENAYDVFNEMRSKYYHEDCKA